MSNYIKRIREKVGHGLLPLPSAAAIIVDENQRLLLGKHKGLSKWTTPGGMVEPGELPADTAKREAWEETGLLVEPVEIMAVHGGPLFQIEYVHGDRAAYTSTWFRCEIIDGELAQSNEEMSELRFFSKEEAEVLEDLMPWAGENLDRIFALGQSTYFQPATWQPD